MKCYIRRIQLDRETWFDKNISEYRNHWVMFRQEAKQFGSVKEARWFIKLYNLKNCEVVK